MKANPVRNFSDGQAVMSVGFYVIIVQVLRLYLLLALVIHGVAVLVTRNFSKKLSVANIVLYCAGLILGYVIIN